MSPVRALLRGLWMVLAVGDGLLVAYLAAHYGWWSFEPPRNVESPGAIILVPIFLAIIAAKTVFFAAFFAAVGSAIAADLAGWRPRRWLAALATPVLLVALAGATYESVRLAREVAARPPGPLADRLTVFVSLTQEAGRDSMDLLGLGAYQAGSIGAYLVILAAAGYLAEKYLLWWWRVRWPVPLLLLAAPLVLVIAVVHGERGQRAYVAAQEWRPAAERQPWLEALHACEALGPDWRLPRRTELTLYVAARPPTIEAWHGAVWTSATADRGAWAVAVDLAPRRSGFWRRESDWWRDEVPCEGSTRRHEPRDWFTALRGRVCALTPDSPDLHPSGKRILATRSGTRVELSQAATLCIRPAAADGSPPLRGRRYEQEREFTQAADYRAFMGEQCARWDSPGWEPGACFAFATEPSTFTETPDERQMRGFCELQRNAEGCHRYALLMEARGEIERANRYQAVACERGFARACPWPVKPAP
jgi:hypothetical protein